MNPEVLNLYLNLAGDYQRFINDLRARLADHPQRLNYIAQYGDWLIDHPLLPVQLATQPARWIHINLILQNEDGREERRTTIAVRDDNVYFIGFKNGNGQWYEFGTEGKSTRFIPGSIFLGCDMSYGALLGDQDLSGINLGMAEAISAVDALCYHQGIANPATKRCLARVCLIICESARMTPHYETVRNGWNAGSTIDPLHVRYTKTWAQMSRALINPACRYPDNLNREGALAVVKLMLNSRLNEAYVGPGHRQQQHTSTPGGGGSSQQGSGSSNPQRPAWRPASGGSSGVAQEHKGHTFRTKPLVQVFSVEVRGFVVDDISTVIVFDGKRGQIIYKHGSQREMYGMLALTGPYRAISAEGSFAIQVHGMSFGADDASDESSRVIGEMLWDCYSKNVEYDKVLIGDIISRIGTDQHTLTKVRYAVWSDAVEATMEVNLLLPAGITSVYGEICAWCESLPVLLFERGPRDDKVELVPSAANSMVPLELGRSVIAVPLLSRYSRVEICVDLHVAHLPSSNEGDVRLFGFVNFYLDKHTGEIRVEQAYGDFFVPVGWTKGSDDPAADSGASLDGKGASGSASPQGTGQTSSEQQVKVQVNIASPGFHVSPLIETRY